MHPRLNLIIVLSVYFRCKDPMRESKLTSKYAIFNDHSIFFIKPLKTGTNYPLILLKPLLLKSHHNTQRKAVPVCDCMWKKDCWRICVLQDGIWYMSSVCEVSPF